ncbi:kinase-like domain-containing protein [Rhizophagus clarus]|uniref:Kinase-like domain-containing protein n=1 Tax=Rhizophagus clarus TaxID=94130 RepID=A0A8H3LXZ0_9GLOM|nr:kinase-like domain-containing protein [Rhizophagus clarus]
MSKWFCLKNNSKNANTSSSDSIISSSLASELDKLNLTKERLKRYASEANALFSNTTLTNTEDELEIKAKSLREEAIFKKLNNIELSMEVDLCFVLDCTKSMKPDISAAKDCILRVFNYVKQLNPSIKLRGMQNVIPFRSRNNDTPEDVLGGLNAAITQMDWKNNTRVLLHICDFPPHGHRFSDLKDNYPDVFDLVGDDPIKLIEKFVKATPSSITYAVSLTSTHGSNFKEIYSLQRNKLDMNPNEPDWSTLSLNNGEVLWFHIPKSLDELKNSIYFNKSNLFCKSLSIKIAPQPFSAGAEKCAYFALDVKNDAANEMVIKEYLHGAKQSNSIEKYLEAVEIPIVANFLSKQFNYIAGRKKIPKVNFLTVKLLRCNTNDCTQYYTIEQRLKNAVYKRFNTNTGVITELRHTLEAFVHFTYEYTKGYLVICDLQGIELNNEFLLTDPAIHCIDPLRFGSTNFGENGIKQLFLANHRCNDICKKLKLSHINNE